MFTREELEALQRRLETAAAALRERRLDEQTVWQLRVDVQAQCRAAAGSPYEGTLAVIAALVESLWRVTHARAGLMRQVGSAGGDATRR